MANYIVEIDGTRPLAQIEMDIQSEELGFSELERIDVAVYQGRRTNLATFNEVSKRPTTIHIVPLNNGVPPGSTEVCHGPIVSSDSPDFVAYR